MIKERYCSYEVAMLLKEKGFDELCEINIETLNRCPFKCRVWYWYNKRGNL